jgi:2-phospho-L-lactate guanylyltransferase
MADAVWAVVVSRVGHGAKSRLAGVLNHDERHHLALTMLADVLAACDRARPSLVNGLVAVVDEPAARWVAERFAAVVVHDRAPGDMNRAVTMGIDAATHRGASTVIVLPGDVPLLAPGDLADLLRAAGRHARAVIIGASRDQTGTNALLLRPPNIIRPAFGPPSVDRHARAGRAAGASTHVLTNLGLALDVDTPADLDKLLLPI